MDTKPQADAGILQRLFSYILHKMCLPTPHDPEVSVEFRHTDNSFENNNNKNKPTMQKTGKEGEGIQEDGGGFRKIDGEGKHVRRSVTIKDDETNKNGLEDQRAKMSNNEHRHHEETNPKPPRHWGPLMSVASNINQKAESFIRSRKKAMARNTTFDLGMS